MWLDHDDFKTAFRVTFGCRHPLTLSLRKPTIAYLIQAPAILATFPWSTQRRSELEDARVMVGRMMIALALLFALVAPTVAQDQRTQDRIAATFYQAQGLAQRSKAALPDNTPTLLARADEVIE
jgi:4-amino-4-deoxy-L-arabinose transferase-like glycosyltransferase